jgi:hypothetical protein
MNDAGALLELRASRVHAEELGEGRDGGERVVQLVRHAGHERAQLRKPVGLEQPALQQHLARHVHGEEQQLGGGLDRVHVHDHRLDFPGRVPRELDRELQFLPLHHGVP